MLDHWTAKEHLRIAHQHVSDALTKLDMAASWLATQQVADYVEKGNTIGTHMLGPCRESLERLAKCIRAAIRD